MNERAERLGGVLKVSSGPGVGTEIVLSAPGQAGYLPKPKVVSAARPR